MTDIEVLLNNILIILTRSGAAVLGIWAIYYFFKNLFGEGGRNPTRIAVAVLVIFAAGAIFGIIPQLLDSGENTGKQLTGGGGYSMAPYNPLADASPTAAGESTQ